MSHLELLAPAGSRESLSAAADFGADAVYAAGKSYGLRAFADNFTPEEIAAFAGKPYAQVAAEAMQAAAEIWLYVPERVALHRIIHAGQGPVLLPQEWLSQLQEQDWSSCFQEGNGQNNLMIRPGQVPACLSHLSGTPFAWLPLCKGQRRLGVLMLSFAHPHVFSLEEKRILGMFAHQFSDIQAIVATQAHGAHRVHDSEGL